ncbi:MAG: glycosyltransferase [Acidimicrobiales bacterium]|nr:glycosyltransferase [Acidimicrobiales bacterium]
MQHWQSDAESTFPTLPDDADADFTVLIRDDAVVPSGFLDRLIATQVTLDVDRLQPAHASGPDGRTAGDRAPPRRGRSRGRRPDPAPRRVGAARRRSRRPHGHRRPGHHRPPDTAEGRRRHASTRPPAASGPRTAANDPSRPIAVDAEPAPRGSACSSPRTTAPICWPTASDRSPSRPSPRDDYEVVLVDDGSEHSALPAMLAEFGDRLHLVGLRIAHAGRSAAKNHAVLLARAPLVLFFDDDDRAAPDYLERHLLAHEARPAEADAVLGHTDWAPELETSPLMHYITDVDRLMFAYERLGPGQELDWRGFWEGRISCKRSLLVHHGLHDQRLEYSIDVEMAWRLASRGLRVTYDPSARSEMVRPLDLDGFCARTLAKGRAHAVVASLHPGTDIAARLLPGDSEQLWSEGRFTEPALRRKAAALEAAANDDPSVLDELHKTYRSLFRLMHAKGVAEATGAVSEVSAPATTIEPFPNTDPRFLYDGTPDDAPPEPLLSISIPVWSRTPELAEMARRTIDRIWEVARIPTEVIVVDNGSPHEVSYAAKVYRYDQNRGVATGWNTGIRLSTADAVVVLNSDCTVEPGWDEALYEAANDGRRVAFPYTDHCDGRGFAWPDQGGTSGWCFMMTKAVYEEVGVFDEWFSPAFCEDTDYWHRAWELGIELSPVPAARVIHARRTSSQARSNLLLQAHRYKYGWKHNVDPDRAPPYYNRDATDYVGTVKLDEGARR